MSVGSTRSKSGQVRVWAVALAAGCLAGAASAYAHADPVDISVVDRDTGQTLPVWRHHGHLYVVGRPGDRYSLHVANHTDHRVEAVMSVDGVNIVTGQTADYRQDGYVLDAYETYDATGWRKSDSEVADFTFAPLPQSYAARTGRPEDVGVIGLAVFDERVPPPPETKPDWRPAWRSPPSAPGAPPPVALMAPPPAPSSVVVTAEKRASAPPPAPSSVIVDAQRRSRPSAGLPSGSASELAQTQPDEKLGTGHGAREWSEVTEVTFERATPYPVFTRQIEYDTYDNLIASGVIPRASYEPRHPRPFPANDSAGFAPDPPDER